MIPAEIEGTVVHNGCRIDGTTGAEPPMLLASCGVERIEMAVVGANVDEPPSYRWSSVQLAAGLRAPTEGAAQGIQGVDISILRAEVDDAIGDHRRREHLGA